MVTVGSILGGNGNYIKYFYLSTPTLMPSSISVGATFSPNPTTNLAIYLTVIRYLASSVLGFIILVHLATYKCYWPYSRLSSTKSQTEGRDNPVSDSFIPHNLFIFVTNYLFSSSNNLIPSVYEPIPYLLKRFISVSSRGICFFSPSSFVTLSFFLSSSFFLSAGF